MAASLLDKLVAGIDQALADAASLRRQFHADPHLGGDEAETRNAFIKAADWLDWRPVADTGAFARTGPLGPTVALRAELDALPITETTGIEWASQWRGIMHACGHDVHLAALWAVLRAARDIELPIGLLPILQPREECTPPGARDVVRSGILDDEQVAAVAAVHMQPAVPEGVVSTGAGAVNAAYDSFEITVQGRGRHGAYPHMSLDPISILATIIMGLPDLATRTVDPIHPTVISVGTVRGGTAPNVTAETATLSGTIRTFNETDRQALHQAIALLAEGTALARGGTATTSVTRGGPALENHPQLVAAVDPLLAGLKIPVCADPFRSCGSDDFGEYGQVAPSLMTFIGTGSADGVGLHHPRFLPGRSALRLAAVALAASYVGAWQVIRDAQPSD